jgi:hypothetical protein
MKFVSISERKFVGGKKSGPKGTDLFNFTQWPSDFFPKKKRQHVAAFSKNKN